MAIYTTFFLCKPDELLTGFPGWRLPLIAPVRREFRNPFTGEVSLVETREPEWPDERETVWREYGVVESRGRYEDYLEGRLPAFVRSRPHWATKGLTEVELRPLCEAAGVGAEFVCPIYGPPSSGAVVQRLPPGLFAELPALDLEAVAVRWAAAMSTPQRTHSESGVKLSDGWSAADASALLKPFVALARQATAGRELFLLVEA